jgi:hypothetical protein
MIRFLTNLLTVICIATLFQCQPSTDTNGQEADATGEEAQAAAAAPQVVSYPSISQEKMMYLYENCDYVDFVLYNTNFSMSQGDQAAIRATLSGVSTKPAQVPSSCQPVGRVFFQVEGVNVEEADLFFGGQCLAYVFYEDGKYAYGNQMTQSGLDFYTKIFSQVQIQQQAQ